jgi:hypothetical protein
MKSLLADDFRIYFESLVEQVMPAMRIRKTTPLNNPSPD